MMTRKPYSLDGGPSFSLGAFLRDNADDPPDAGTIKRIRALKLGQPMTLGGGAGAEFQITRVDEFWKGK
ncbi:MAG: hypothetical protein ACYC6M_05020 [Terriglobales bacterium]